MRNLLSALMLLFASSAWANSYSIIDQSTTQVGSFSRTVWTIQEGSDPLNRFKMYRVHRENEHPQNPIILAPSLPDGFKLYEESVENEYEKSFVGVLAGHSYDVWGYSQRVEGIVPGTCEASPTACSAMQTWGLNQLLDDLDYVRTHVAAADGAVKPVVGGLSMGSILGYAAANRNPTAYAGIIGIDGAHYEVDASARAFSAQFCQILDGALQAGVYYDSSIQGFKGLAALALNAPNDPSPVPGFPPGITNRQAFVLALSLPSPSPVSFRPNYIVMAGDYTDGTLFYGNLDYFARATAQDFTDYASIRTIRDIQCSLAGIDNTWYNNLSAYTGKIFVHVSGQGFGASNTDTAALATSAEADVFNYQLFGHVDAFFSNFRRNVIDNPLLHWLKHKAF